MHHRIDTSPALNVAHEDVSRAQRLRLQIPAIESVLRQVDANGLPVSADFFHALGLKFTDDAQVDRDVRSIGAMLGNELLRPEHLANQRLREAVRQAFVSVGMIPGFERVAADGLLALARQDERDLESLASASALAPDLATEELRRRAHFQVQKRMPSVAASERVMFPSEDPGWRVVDGPIPVR